jgi:hypothetical protein
MIGSFPCSDTPLMRSPSHPVLPNHRQGSASRSAAPGLQSNLLLFAESGITHDFPSDLGALPVENSTFLCTIFQGNLSEVTGLPCLLDDST